MTSEHIVVVCPACQQPRHADQLISGKLIPPEVAVQIAHQHPDWSPDQCVCEVCVRQGKAGYLEGLLEGPIILFSQRKQAQRDRMRAQNDYRVNLKESWKSGI